MLKVASLIFAAVLCSLMNNSQVVAQVVGPATGGKVSQISNRCRGADPTKLTPDARDKAREAARWYAAQNWKIKYVDVYKCKSNNQMEMRVSAVPLDNDHNENYTRWVSFLFFESHKSFRKALTLHSGFEMKVQYTPIDQDTLWSEGEGEDRSFVKFLGISKIE